MDDGAHPTRSLQEQPDLVDRNILGEVEEEQSRGGRVHYHLKTGIESGTKQLSTSHSTSTSHTLPATQSPAPLTHYQLHKVQHLTHSTSCTHSPAPHTQYQLHTQSSTSHTVPAAHNPAPHTQHLTHSTSCTQSSTSHSPAPHTQYQLHTVQHLTRSAT